MGKPVTIDSDDLQVLLFNSGAVKQIETAVKAFYTDPLGMQVRESFTEVHDRVAQQWRAATKDPKLQDPVLLEPLTMQEADYMEKLVKTSHFPDIMGDSDEEMRLIRALRKKMCLQAGTERHFIEWADSKDRTSLGNPRTVVRVGYQGYEKLAQHQEKRAQKPMQPNTGIDVV